MKTVEATIDEAGHVSLLKPLRLPTRRRAFVTILEEEGEDLAPARTVSQMAAAHRERAADLAANGADYVSLDLPLVDDGADW